MSCREYRSGLIEWGRGRAPGEAVRQVLVEHLEECSECARFLESQQALTSAMDDLAAAPIPPASEFFDAVMAGFDRAHPPRRPPVIPIRYVLAVALAAAILLAVILAPHRATRNIQARRPIATAAVKTPASPITPAIATADSTRATAPPRRAAFREAAPEPEQPFYPIPYTAPLAPGEWTRVERMKIPVGALIAVGFHAMVSDPAATVEADVLVSQDGRARAIRPIGISNSN
jgi:hypothetical protein